MKSIHPASFLITLITFFLTTGFRQTAFSQTRQALDVPAIEKAVYLNKQSGKPDYYGIIEKYEITFNDAEVADKYRIQIISEIKKISGVNDCVFDIPNLMVIVTVPKQGEKDNRARNLERIKAAMAAYDLKFITCKEGTYYK